MRVDLSKKGGNHIGKVHQPIDQIFHGPCDNNLQLSMKTCVYYTHPPFLCEEVKSIRFGRHPTTNSGAKTRQSSGEKQKIPQIPKTSVLQRSVPFYTTFSVH